MDSAPEGRTPGLALRWVEVTDVRGRSRLEMRWSEAVGAGALAAEAVEALAAATVPPRVTPAA